MCDLTRIAERDLIVSGLRGAILFLISDIDSREAKGQDVFWQKSMLSVIKKAVSFLSEIEPSRSTCLMNNSHDKTQTDKS